MNNKPLFHLLIATLLLPSFALAESAPTPTFHHHRRHHRRHHHPRVILVKPEEAEIPTVEPVIVTAHPLSDTQLASLNANISANAPRMQSPALRATMSDFSPDKETLRIAAQGSADFSPHDQASCSTVDMRPQFGDLRNQDGVGWCFAEAGADLLSQKLGKRVSMMDLSILYYQQNGIVQQSKTPSSQMADWAGGSTAYAMAAVAHRGNICSEAEMPDDFSQAYLAKPLKAGEDISSRLNRVQILDKDYFRHINDAVSNKLQNSDITCTAANDLREMFPMLNLPTLIAALKDGDDALSVLNWLRQLDCRNPIPVPKDLNIVDETAKEGEGQTLMANIDANLNRGQALGISYNYGPFNLGSKYTAGK